MKNILIILILVPFISNSQSLIKIKNLEKGKVSQVVRAGVGGVPKWDTLKISDIKGLQDSLNNSGGGVGAIASVFGRTGVVTAQSGDYSFSLIGSKPTTLFGYGITDAYPLVGNPSGFLTSVPAQSWSSITGKPTFATVATSGSYLDLTNLPTIPTNTNQLTNGSGFLTNITGLVTQGTNVTITGSGTSGSPYVVNASGGGGISLTNTSGTGNATLVSTVLNIPPSINNQSASAQTGTFWITGTIRGQNAGSGAAIIAGPSAAATGNNSFAIGNSASTGSSNNAGALLRGASAVGDDALAIGISASATTSQAIAIGVVASSAASNAMALGFGASARSYQELAIGSYNTSYTASSTGAYNAADPIFTIGTGTASGDRSNALTISKNTLRTVQIGLTSAKPTYTSSAILQIDGTTGGLLLPRMTKTQRDAISSPVAGLAVYQTDNTPGLRVYNGTNWMKYTETAD